MLSRELSDKVAGILQHPFGNRIADEVLAHAVLRGHLGLKKRRPGAPVDPVTDPDYKRRKAHGSEVLPSIVEGLAYARRVRAGQGHSVGTGNKASPHRQRLWRIPRSWQLDQGNTPQCVAYTLKHVELCQPIGFRVGRSTPGSDYARMKQIDGYPNEEGTSFEYALQVAKEQGIVERSWQYQGEEDFDAITQWILDVGPVGLGAYWSESMFRTDKEGLIEVAGELQYGHETAVIGTDLDAEEDIILNSWGNDRFGIEGRGRLKWADRRKLLAADGDLYAFVEQRAPRAR